MSGEFDDLPVASLTGLSASYYNVRCRRTGEVVPNEIFIEVHPDLLTVGTAYAMDFEAASELAALRDLPSPVAVLVVAKNARGGFCRVLGPVSRDDLVEDSGSE